MESKLIGATDGVAGDLRLARSRNDMCMTWSYMAVRDGLPRAMEQFLYLRSAIVLFAEEYKDTLCIIHTHTQHAQPGLLGRYFPGATDMLECDFKRLCRAYDAVNQSPTGAAAVTTTGSPVSRKRVVELAGFSGMIENTYDAIGNSDYLMQTASALGLCALDMGRIITDLLFWATQEANMVRVAGDYISISSIMPQKRNPAALGHLRSSLSALKGMANMILTGLLKGPYGDISDYEGIEDSIFGCLELFQKNVQLFRAVTSTLEVNKELSENRAYESFSAVTGIAGQIHRSYKIPFRKAHSFASSLVKRAGIMDYSLKNIPEELFSSAYREFLEEPFILDFIPILQCINPQHFIKCREVRGGTGGKTVKSMIDRTKREVEANLLWVRERKRQLRGATEARKQVIQKKLDKF